MATVRTAKALVEIPDLIVSLLSGNMNVPRHRSR